MSPYMVGHTGRGRPCKERQTGGSRTSDYYILNEQIHQRLMKEGSFSPIEWMLNLWSYGMKIAYYSTQRVPIYWAGD